jgi:hypothetical protein
MFHHAACRRRLLTRRWSGTDSWSLATFTRWLRWRIVAAAAPSSTISVAFRSSIALFPHHNGMLLTRTRSLVQVPSAPPRSHFSMLDRLTELITCNARILCSRSLSSPYLDSSFCHSNHQCSCVLFCLSCCV